MSAPSSLAPKRHKRQLTDDVSDQPYKQQALMAGRTDEVDISLGPNDARAAAQSAFDDAAQRYKDAKASFEAAERICKGIEATYEAAKAACQDAKWTFDCANVALWDAGRDFMSAQKLQAKAAVSTSYDTTLSTLSEQATSLNARAQTVDGGRPGKLPWNGALDKVPGSRMRDIEKHVKKAQIAMNGLADPYSVTGHISAEEGLVRLQTCQRNLDESLQNARGGLPEERLRRARDFNADFQQYIIYYKEASDLIPSSADDTENEIDGMGTVIESVSDFFADGTSQHSGSSEDLFSEGSSAAMAECFTATLEAEDLASRPMWSTGTEMHGNPASTNNSNTYIAAVTARNAKRKKRRNQASRFTESQGQRMIDRCLAEIRSGRHSGFDPWGGSGGRQLFLGDSRDMKAAECLGMDPYAMYGEGW